MFNATRTKSKRFELLVQNARREGQGGVLTERGSSDDMGGYEYVAHT